MTSPISSYQEALDYLYSYIDFSLTRSDRYSPDRFNLDRMFELMDALGNPQRAYRSIHVAGTKGKGSVCAMCASALGQAGYQVGLYTSPHGIEFTERIQVNGQQIPPSALVELVRALRPAVESIPELTTFEISTALAMAFFAERAVDVAVFEVGLGGRLDATNILTPDVSVITSISFDHTQFLGESLKKIATEKAGIIKPGVPVVLAPQQDAARQAVQQIAAEREAPLVQVGEEYLFAPWHHDLQGQTLLLWSRLEQPLANAYIEAGGASDDWEPVRLHIPLLGAHQVVNAATAYAALMIARQGGLPIGEAAILRGFGAVRWPGRFEVLQRHPPVLVDAAHNRDSALKLRLALDDYFPGLPVVLIYGASEDKDIKGMLQELLPRSRVMIATRSIHPRAIEPETLVSLAHQYGKPARQTDTVEAALQTALEQAESEAVVLATGSLFVAMGVRQAWFARQPVRAEP